MSGHGNYPKKEISKNVSSKISFRKPYMGWRSQENINDGEQVLYNTPNQRLANSLRKSKFSGSLGSGLSTWRKESSNRPPDWYIKDSIKSVSCAIAEFCRAGDVPADVPSREEISRRQRSRGRCRDHSEPKPKIIWLESSFVTATNDQSNILSK
jgi:hypothetical protein